MYYVINVQSKDVLSVKSYRFQSNTSVISLMNKGKHKHEGGVP